MSIQITGTGSSIPEYIQPNIHFSKNTFFEASGAPINRPNAEVIEKFKQQPFTGASEFFTSEKSLILVLKVVTNGAHMLHGTSLFDVLIY